MAGGIGANRFWDRTLQWFADEGMVGVERLHGAEWQTVEHLQSEEAKHIFNEVYGPWAMQRSKAELYHGGQARKIPIAPVSSPADIVENRQLQSRGHFVDVPQGMGGRTLRMPGAPYQLSETPWRVQRPAPGLGEHNLEVWAEHESRRDAVEETSL
jgi:benzylsuccinate CoA-transferase BbsE subunit